MISMIYVVLTHRQQKKIQLTLSFFKKIHLCSFAYLRQASLTYRDPRIINLKDYKRFQNYVFWKELLSDFLNNLEKNEEWFSVFLHICKKILDLAPCKQKHAHGNYLTLSKELIKRTTLKNKFLKDRNGYDKRIFTVCFLLENRKLNCSNFHEKKTFFFMITKLFWQIIKPFLSDKIIKQETDFKWKGGNPWNWYLIQWKFWIPSFPVLKVILKLQHVLMLFQITLTILSLNRL